MQNDDQADEDTAQIASLTRKQPKQVKSAMSLDQYVYDPQKEKIQQQEPAQLLAAWGKSQGQNLMKQISESKESSDSSNKNGLSPKKQEFSKEENEQENRQNQSPKRNPNLHSNQKKISHNTAIESIDQPIISRKHSALLTRESFRNRCKNSLVLNKCYTIMTGNQQSATTGESGGNQFRSAISEKSYSVRSSNYSQNGDGYEDEDDERLDDLSPIDIEDFDVSHDATPNEQLKSKKDKKQTSRNTFNTNDNQSLPQQKCDQTSRYSQPCISSQLLNGEIAFEDQYIQEDYLGEGCSSVVRVWKQIKDPFVKYAVKEMRVPDREYFDIAKKEFSIIEELNSHPNIVKVYDIFYNQLKEKVYIVMEYAGEGCNLHDYIKQSRDQEIETKEIVITEEKIIQIMDKLLQGLAYLHDNKVCHRDIKPSNIYITTNHEQLKILDFNVALKFNSSQKMFGQTGEEDFSAPELYGGKTYDEKVDLWSAGIVLYQLLTRGKKLKVVAYGNDDNDEDMQEGIDKKLLEVNCCNEEIKQLLCNLLKVNSSERVSAKEALQMKWIQNGSRAL